MPHPEIPAVALRKEQELAEAEPDVNPWACLILLVITVGLMGVTAEFVRFTRLSPLPRGLISSLPIARRQQLDFRRKRITDQRRVRVLSPRYHKHIFVLLKVNPIHSRIIGGSVSSSSHSCPSPPTVLLPSLSSFVPSCDNSSIHHNLQISSLRVARST